MNHIQKVKNLYKDWAEVYDESSAKGLPFKLEENVLIKLVAPHKVDKILDLGCGTGRVTEELYKYTKNLWGVDLSKEMLEVAKQKFPNINFQEVDITKRFPFKDNEFDKIVSSLTFQFIKDIRFTLSEIYRVLKKDGKTFITDFVSSAPLDWKLVEYKTEKVFKASVGDVSTFHSLAEYIDAADSIGFKSIQIKPLRIKENAKSILTEKSYEKVEGNWASCILVLEK